MSRAAILMLILAGCVTAPEIKPPAIPASLVAPCLFDEPTSRTNGELLSAYAEALYVIRSCDARFESLRNLVAK